MPKRGIIFDLDGVIFNSEQEGAKRALEIAAERGLPTDEERRKKITACWGMLVPDIVRRVWPEEREPHDFHSAWQEIDKTRPIPLFKRANEILELFSRRFALSVLTNRHDCTAYPQLRANGILFKFFFVCTIDNMPLPKPYPASMDPLLRRYGQMGIGKEELVYVGDTVRNDWELAREVGIDFVAVVAGSVVTAEDFLKAGLPRERIIKDIADLLALINRL